MKTPAFWSERGTASALLAPLGAAYAAGGLIRRWMVRSRRAGVPVICVGNVVAGGAGKTPVAIAIARRLAERSHAPHLLSRGYRGSREGPVRVDPQRHTAEEVGDEPLLLARAAPTWVCRDRPGGAAAAVAAGAELLVLDDGLQNPTLRQDLSLLVVDGGFGFGNGRLIPAGPLREPVALAAARCHAAIVMGDDLCGVTKQLLPCMPVLHAVLKPQENVLPPDRPVIAFAGIGRPEKFFSTIEALGCQIVERLPFPDHHRYSAAELTRLLNTATRHGAVLATTEKDLVRLPPTFRGKVTPVPVTVAWEDVSALDRLLDRVLQPG